MKSRILVFFSLALIFLLLPDQGLAYSYSTINVSGGSISGTSYYELTTFEEANGWHSPYVKARVYKGSFQLLFESNWSGGGGYSAQVSFYDVPISGSGYYEVRGENAAYDANWSFQGAGVSSAGTSVTDPNDGPPVMWGLNPSSSNNSSGYIEIYGQRLYPANGWSTVHMDNLGSNGGYYPVYQSNGQINIYYYGMPGGSHNVWVETNNGSSGWTSFQVTGQEPVVSGLYPSYGTTGVPGSLEVSGSHLYPDYGWNSVKIDGMPQSILWHNGENSVTISYSGLSAGTHYVTVETANGSSSGSPFYVGDPTPYICSLSPSSAWQAGTRSYL